MPSPQEIAEKHARILGEIAAFGLDLARKLHDQAMAAEEPQVTADLAKAFHAVSRTLRQTMLLEARVVSDGEGLARQARAAAEAAACAPVEARVARISQVIGRITEAAYDDTDEGDRIYEEVTDRLEEDKLEPGFLDQPIDAQIERLCKAFGLPLPQHPVERPRPRDPEAPPGWPAASAGAPPAPAIGGQPQPP